MSQSTIGNAGADASASAVAVDDPTAATTTTFSLWPVDVMGEVVVQYNRLVEMMTRVIDARHNASLPPPVADALARYSDDLNTLRMSLEAIKAAVHENQHLSRFPVPPLIEAVGGVA